MSDHKKPMSPELRQSLIDHRLPTDTPSQLSDSFRHGFAAGAASRDAEVEALRADALRKDALLKQALDLINMGFDYSGDVFGMHHNDAVDISAAIAAEGK